MNAIHYPYPGYRLIQFAKAPRAGEVKTRLQPVLGGEGCRALHARLVEHCFESLHRAAVAPVELAVTGGDTGYFRQLAGKTATPVTLQAGSDLGERMLNAAAARLPGADGVIIVGSDCPFFSGDYLHRACRALAGGADCVLGPAEDGGYVLIGLRRADPLLFADIPWGAEQVLAMTRRRLSRLDWRWRELEPLADIDRPRDLQQLQRLWGNGGGRLPESAKGFL